MGAFYENEPGIDMKLRIVRAVMQAAETQPFAQMKVGEICKLAGISRQTFYRHFMDKYDVLTWYNEQLYHRFSHDIGTSLTMTEARHEMILKAHEERLFYAMALKTVEDYNSLLPTISRQLYENWSSSLSSLPNFPYTPRMDFQLKALSKIGPQIIAEWVAGGCQAPIDEFEPLFDSIVPPDLIEIIDGYVSNRRKQHLC